MSFGRPAIVEAEASADELYLADTSGGDLRERPLDLWVMPVHEGLHQQDTSTLARANHRACLVRRHPQRLLAEHMLARRGGARHPLGV